MRPARVMPPSIFVLFTLLLTNPLAAKPQQLFFGGAIYTMDSEQPKVEAMLVEGGRIAALGGKKQLVQRYPQAQLNPLNGATLLPGFIDSHVHVLSLGSSSLVADVSHAATVQEMVETLQAFYPNPEPGVWLVGQGWDEGAWASRSYPDRALLDKAFPSNPVKLESRHGFAAF